MVLSMLLFGGETLHYFAMALTIGILFGIYSSVFVAAAIAMWLGIRREDLIKARLKKTKIQTTRTRAPWFNSHFLMRIRRVARQRPFELLIQAARQSA
jgi:hypothetical protein